MTNYRPATKEDVGRTDVEFSYSGTKWSPPQTLTEFIPLNILNNPYWSGKYAYTLARVPILPEECSHEWHRTLGGEYSECVKCGHVPVHSDKPIHCAMNKGEPMNSDEPKLPRLIEGPRWNQFPGEPNPMRTDLPENWKEKYLREVVSVHTIRRKLEAGGYAEAEQAVMLEGKLYPVDFIKSVPGVLPQQVEIV